MQDTELLKYGKYLTSLIASVILKTTPPAPFEGIDWKELFKLAKMHDSTTVIYPALTKFDIPEDALQLFEKEKNLIVSRTTRQDIEAERVLGTLEKNDIKYIRLKGSHIKDLYPAPCMRTFCDIDIYVSKEDRERAKPLMRELGYILDCEIDYHDEYKKDDFYVYEIHSPLVSENSFHHNLFTDPFNKAKASQKNKFDYVLNNEYFYLHLFFHLYGHFIHRGCGIRLFTDLLIFKESIPDVDYSFIESVLKQYDMLGFYQSVQKLIDFFFFNKPADDDTLTVAEYIFSCQANSAFTNTLANYSLGDKIKYFSKMWFPPANRLIFRYPVLEKAPFLLPICWIRRFFYSLFFKRIVFIEQTNNIKSLNRKEFKAIKKARKLATKNKI